MQANNEKTQLALREASKEVSSFVADAELEVKKIEDEYASIVPIAEARSDYEFCKSVRKDVLPIKTKMESARKSLKTPIIEMGKMIDGSMKPLIDRLDAVYKPFEDAYREVDNRKKRLEEERQAKIQDAFDKMNDAAMDAIGQSAIGIESIMDTLCDWEFDPDVFQDRIDEAVLKHSQLMEKLSKMLEAQKNQEALEARQAEIERIEAENRAKEEEQARMAREAEIRAQAEAEAEKRYEREKAEAKERAKQAAIEAERRAKEAADRAAQEERQRIEQQRIAEQKEAEEREADRKHKAEIHNEIVGNFVTTGITEAQAKKVVELIAKRKAGNVFIKY